MLILTFIKKLSDNDKAAISKIVGDKKLILHIKKYLFEEGNLEKIFLCNGSYELAEYCIKMERINDFKSFIDSHRNFYSHLKGCHMIIPQFKELYEYAYS